MDRRFMRPIGVLCILVSLPALEAGVLAAEAFFQLGDAWRASLSSAASLGAILLFAGGGLLCAQRDNGRRLAYSGAILSIAACSIGALIQLVGGHGILDGVADPIAIILLLRATPPLSRLKANEHDHVQRHGAASPLMFGTALNGLRA